MSIKVKGYIHVTREDQRGFINIMTIQSVGEHDGGKTYIATSMNNSNIYVDQSFDEVCALIKEDQE